MKKNSLNFLAIIRSKDFDVFFNYYNKYNKRHLRVKYKNADLYITLFEVRIEETFSDKITISGFTGESLMASFILGEEYLLVFDTEKTTIGKIEFIDFE